ncbi:glycerophosphodiester phosphodiesterase (plasmid) [Haloarcula sp. NS06]|uniref:glycerophosphodiester phosphodiesterase n=1 Tax=Haloarcula sp. NS06 TaxID=3409688 RepID=UPI003DA77327
MSWETSEDPSIVAHRGFAGRYPENTAPAVRAASAHEETELVEVDVVPTADGTVVCFHDNHLHRRGENRGVTDAHGVVWETDTETVTGATVLDSGATVPRFGTVLDALEPGVGINVELKNPGSTDSAFASSLSRAARERECDLWQPFVTNVVESLKSFDGPVLVSSFYEGALAALESVAPDLRSAVLIWESLTDGLEIARRYEVDAVHPPWNLVRGTPFVGEPFHLDRSPVVSEDIVAAAHDAGMSVNVWTVETWFYAEQLARAGVDGLIVDYPRLLRRGKGRPAG